MRQVKLGFIGCGICARDLHWPALAQLTDKFTVTNVCSRTAEKAARFAALVGAPKYCTHVDELLADPDVEAVMINYPFEMNYELTKKALAAGKHVIVEKPMARDMADAAAMVELEKQTDLVTMIAENYRYRKTITTAKKWIGQGAIGKPAAALVTVYAHFPRDAKWLTESSWRLSCVGGIMLDRDVHWFATMRDLFGEVRHAIGYQSRIREDIGPVDQVSLHMVFENGAMGTFTDIASLEGIDKKPYVLVGSEGTIVIEDFCRV
ncbi:MAG: Gfo/Idh/MocA family oxidoreductase, partial [Christensenellaceae bacterium]|nr:Gfo/Idh/MocA family oxidoreductase [Christensenellaceae bacterium]